MISLAVGLVNGCSSESTFAGVDPTPEEAFLTQEAIPGCSDALDELLLGAEHTGRPAKDTRKETLLISYQVSGDDITVSELPPVHGKLEALQQDASLHAEIWNQVTTIIPTAYRKGVVRFHLFSDGPGGVMGAVEQGTTPGEWTISVDIQDASDLPGFATTLIHETAHLFTLEPSQVEAYLPLFEDPRDEEAYAFGEAACDTLFLYEGCTHPDSYINLFFDRFWGDIYEEWLEIQAEDRDTKRETLLMGLYDRNASDFVSSYAVTSPEEDIAESFLYFTLLPRPAGDNLAQEKVLFFHENPEMVNLRSHIRTNLCNLLIP